MDARNLREANQSIYDILELVRKRPPIYLDEYSIKRLRSFLVGYQGGLISQGFEFRDEKPDFHGFNDWVAKRLGFFESTAGWCNMILEKSANERDALEHFFVLLNEFKKEFV
jgi:hypothetical protein